MIMIPSNAIADNDSGDDNTTFFWIGFIAITGIVAVNAWYNWENEFAFKPPQPILVKEVSEDLPDHLKFEPLPQTEFVIFRW